MLTGTFLVGVVGLAIRLLLLIGLAITTLTTLTGLIAALSLTRLVTALSLARLIATLSLTRLIATLSLAGLVATLSLTRLVTTLARLITSLTRLVAAILSLTGTIAVARLYVLSVAAAGTIILTWGTALTKGCSESFGTEAVIVTIAPTVVCTLIGRALTCMYTRTRCTSCFSLKTFLLCWFFLLLFVILEIHNAICFYLIIFLYM